MSRESELERVLRDVRAVFPDAVLRPPVRIAEAEAPGGTELVPGPVVRVERVLFSSSAAQVVVIEGAGSRRFEKRSRFSEHVELVLAETGDAGVAASWVEHLERLAELVGAPGGRP